MTRAASRAGPRGKPDRWWATARPATRSTPPMPASGRAGSRASSAARRGRTRSPASSSSGSSGLVYFVAFLIAARQFAPLIGHHGLLPADAFLDHVARASGSRAAGFWELPSVFWLGASDAALRAAAWIGVVLSLFVLAGATNCVRPGSRSGRALSLVRPRRPDFFYGYGWEFQALRDRLPRPIFLCPLTTLGPFPEVAARRRPSSFSFAGSPPRIMLGAALIKLRGDPCWRDLTCLVYHYETQPNPNPLAWLLHQAPPWFHAFGVLANHAVEIVAPFFAFGPRRARHVAERGDESPFRSRSSSAATSRS